ncbi:hypothetical protein [Actinopolymorpha sp. B9G3]|uniref:hypothetical protein n=1 Tax=Actinopolymorpha sp. B9G3 TaxID=3158970 RepID=UPI0032D96F69
MSTSKNARLTPKGGGSRTDAPELDARGSGITRIADFTAVVRHDYANSMRAATQSMPETRMIRSANTNDHPLMPPTALPSGKACFADVAQDE